MNNPRNTSRSEATGTLAVTICLLIVCFLVISAREASAQRRSSSRRPAASGQVIESGKFRIYETKQMQGEESYEIRRGPSGLVATVKFNLPYWGEELKPKLDVTLRMKSDLTPQSFRIKGIRPLEVPIDTAVTVQGPAATVREGKRSRRVRAPANFFTFAGYAPVTIEMLMVRYWLKRELKTPLQLLPAGEALIEHRGNDTITVGGKSASLERYTLGGKNRGAGWGKQTLWFDSEDRLVAVVNLASDLETNFYAIRDGYESEISFFLRRTAEDGVERLTKLAESLRPQNETTLALVGGTLIDVTGKPPIVDAAVVIEGDRIIAAGPLAKVKIPVGAAIVDASGKYLLPGLWDMHSHNYLVEFGPAYLAAGITTARDVGNDIEFATTLRDAAKQRRGLGPRMLLAGYIDGKNEGRSFDVQVDTPADARAAVQRYKDAGFEQIKIRDHVKPEILKVITAEAHRLGMTVTGHVPESMNAIDAAKAGMDQISHLNFVVPVFAGIPAKGRGEMPEAIDFESKESRAALKAFKDNDTSIDPTMSVLELMTRLKNAPLESIEPGMAKVAPELVEQLNKKGGYPAEAGPQINAVIKTLLKVIEALHRAGVPIVAGTDVGVPGHTLHRELELYVKAGLTPLEAIQTATTTPAHVMKLEKEVGTIEAGKRADLIVLDANPLENISNIRRLRFVVAQGRMFECTKLWESVGFKP